uniref:Uncharacterized protein n=1 Tax=Amphiprion ocellaris TaxID=80972 RepID=A0AAQ5ZPY6_AMPOC
MEKPGRVSGKQPQRGALGCCRHQHKKTHTALVTDWLDKCIHLLPMVCSPPTFNLDSRRVWSSGLFPPSSPVLTETLGLGDEGAQRVFLEPVRVFE